MVGIGDGLVAGVVGKGGLVGGGTGTGWTGLQP